MNSRTPTDQARSQTNLLAHVQYSNSHDRTILSVYEWRQILSQSKNMATASQRMHINFKCEKQESRTNFTKTKIRKNENYVDRPTLLR